jgi:hypothetical protein
MINLGGTLLAGTERVHYSADEALILKVRKVTF